MAVRFRVQRLRLAGLSDGALLSVRHQKSGLNSIIRRFRTHNVEHHNSRYKQKQNSSTRRPIRCHYQQLLCTEPLAATRVGQVDGGAGPFDFPT